MTSPSLLNHDLSLTLRIAGATDERNLTRLQELDGRRLPAGEHLVAETGGELIAAAHVQTGEFVSDPFRFTAPVVSVLRARAAQLRTAR